MDKLARLRTGAYLLISYHNYGGTPPRMDTVLRRMTRIPADGYKLVTTARKPSDNQRVLALGRGNPKTPTVLLAMGETGFATRVLSPSFGGLYTLRSSALGRRHSFGPDQRQRVLPAGCIV